MVGNRGSVRHDGLFDAAGLALIALTALVFGALALMAYAVGNFSG